jgi:hypothetical protein
MTKDTDYDLAVVATDAEDAIMQSNTGDHSIAAKKRRKRAQAKRKIKRHVSWNQLPCRDTIVNLRVMSITLFGDKYT